MTVAREGQLKLRDALKGGRTNNIRFMHETAHDENIRYLDVCSLYPSQLKRQKYPLGHPVKIIKDFDMSLQSYFGLVQCAIDPPARLRLGVLPLTINGKLSFPLCTICAKQQVSTFCRHTKAERRLKSTWTTVELNHALARGYKMYKIYTVLHWPESTDTLFAPYIDMWLKHKTEASGWPQNLNTPEAQEQFIAEFYAREGVQLDAQNMQLNPGKRFIAKLMLNSLWGKLAQKHNLTTTSIVTNQVDMRKILLDADKAIDSVYCPTASHMVICWHWVDEDNARAGQTNLAVASFVTAYGRHTLLNILEEIEQVRTGRVLYFDTDSVIFIEKQGDPVIPTGNFLGDLTDEVDPGWVCDLFACGGPKNYLVRLRKDEQTKIKIRAKGLVLTSEANQIINVDSMIDMCRRFISGEEVVHKIPQFRIHSNYKTGSVRSIYNLKKYRVSSDKRLKLPGDNDTWPYGFIDCPTCGTDLNCACVVLP